MRGPQGIEWRLNYRRGSSDATRSPDARVALLAASQHGVVAHHEALECGLSERQIFGRIERGALHRRFEGIYAVGHPALSFHGELVAALKAAGGDALVSCGCAVALLRLGELGPDAILEVTRVGSSRGKHPGLFVHRTNRLDPVDRWTVDGIPVTAPARTIVDMSARLSQKRLRRLARQALAQKLVTFRELVDALDRLRPFRGTRKLARVLATGPVPTRSELEDILYDLVVRAGFEPPDVNVPLRIAGRRVVPDLRWPAQRLVVEADGAQYHSDPLARADDAERQALLEAVGERVIRVTWKQAVERAAETLKRIGNAGAPHRVASELPQR